MTVRYRARLILLDEESPPESITQQTGIIPSRTWLKGEFKPNTRMPYKENGWELKSSLPDELPLADHITHILSTVESAGKLMKNFTDKFYSIIECAVYYGEEMPELYFENDIIKRLADFNLRLDIDLYCVE